MSSGSCYHCGDSIIGKPILHGDKTFCCAGCRSVYELLEESGLNTFYTLEQGAGTKPLSGREQAFAFLDLPELRQKFIDYEDENSTHVTLFIPSIHCSSCIYLLENLHRIDPRIQSCLVHFTRRQANIVFQGDLPLSELAALLDAIGYTPNFSSRSELEKKRNYTYIYKLGIAGFAFGSIMLWTFPEYLGLEKDNSDYRTFASWLSFAVSIPVLLYSANEYLISAWKAILHKNLNLDVPITLGIIALYAQSCYSIVVGNGPGYMDSFAGFIFFLLIGKWFQNKTYEALSFDRDYTAYFPVAVTRMSENVEELVEIDRLEIGDEMLIRNQEIIPCDALVSSEEVRIDYSFVTGESVPVLRKKGDFIYAGGKLLGSKSLFRVEKKSSRSHLTQLWNEGERRKNKEEAAPDKISIYFLTALLSIALATALIWLFIDASRTTEVLVSVLIVACPCALALSRPFTYGNTMRALGRKGLYLKNAAVIEKMNGITDIVFDKTGTLTSSNTSTIHYEGQALSEDEKAQILSVVLSSTHPLSRGLSMFLKDEIQCVIPEVLSFEESSGAGIEASIECVNLRVGSHHFVLGTHGSDENETSVHISINDRYKGRFVFQSEFRPGIFEALHDLAKTYRLHVLSGDSEKDRNTLERDASCVQALLFQQKPGDKLAYINLLKHENAQVMMIGDGLNDAGALDAADVGIAVSENVFSFTPGSDAIARADQLKNLKNLLVLSKHARTVLLVCFIFSGIYNLVGLSIAISGHLTPLIAAILMPLSSITIVVISTLLVRLKQ
ncbi:MAG: hypothetical protein A3D92_14090 [Bacteroidetes bacterium RIFCSPHIGHO2_02_FULL_44_7]|nr:MAG: hypothetical protein A3D92_14090 [Bacteroidetes bacterium RIFCSPHIGHO2_02_FULL_44_7]